MKEGKYIKALAKIQVGAIFHTFIDLYMETQCWCPSGWSLTLRLETNRNMCHGVVLVKGDSSLEELINTDINSFAPGDFAEKRVLKLVEWFSGHCRAIKS